MPGTSIVEKDNQSSLYKDGLGFGHSTPPGALINRASPSLYIWPTFIPQNSSVKYFQVLEPNYYI